MARTSKRRPVAPRYDGYRDGLTSDLAAATDADILLDFVTGGALEALPRAENEPILERIDKLMLFAVRMYLARYPRARKHVSAPGRGWSLHGVMWDYRTHRDGEHDALCIFCRASLMTLGAGSHHIHAEIVRRFERHAFECALRGLLLTDHPFHRAWRCPIKGLQ